MTDRQLMQQALDALEGLADYRYTKPVETTIKALRERLSHCDRCGKKLGGEGDIHTCTPKPVQEPVAWEHHEYRPYGAPGEIRIHAILASQYTMPDGSVSGNFQWLVNQYKEDKNTIKLIPLYTTRPAAPMTEFEEAVAACDNTLHHAINHWQDRALKAEAKLAQPEQEPVAQLGDGVFWCDTCRSVQEAIHHSDPNERDVWCKGDAKWLQGPFYTTPPAAPVQEPSYTAADVLEAHTRGYELGMKQQPAPVQPEQEPVSCLSKTQAKAILGLALDLEKTGRMVVITHGQERTDFVARNRNIQCALEDALRNAATPPAAAQRKPLTGERRGFMVMEHLGPAALTGGKMSVCEAFMLGITATEAEHGIE
jgi:hypothetical protein